MVSRRRLEQLSRRLAELQRARGIARTARPRFMSLLAAACASNNMPVTIEELEAILAAAHRPNGNMDVTSAWGEHWERKRLATGKT